MTAPTFVRPSIQTRSGAFIDLVNPRPETIFFDDIVWSLCRQPRYAAHTRRPLPAGVFTLAANAPEADGSWDAYSIAEHSIYLEEGVAKMCGPFEELSASEMRENAKLRLDAILHDAHEFASQDITTPMKQAISIVSGFNGSPVDIINNRIQLAIYSALGLPTAAAKVWPIGSPQYTGGYIDGWEHHAIRDTHKALFRWEAEYFMNFRETSTSPEWPMNFASHPMFAPEEPQWRDPTQTANLFMFIVAQLWEIAFDKPFNPPMSSNYIQ